MAGLRPARDGADLETEVIDVDGRFEAAVDLLWIPLGAGGHVVRLNGKAFEALSALMQRHPRLDLYHAALQVTAGGASYVIELAPVPDRDGQHRGVVGEGPVGSRWLGRLRIFRYELRRWRGGIIPRRRLRRRRPAAPDQLRGAGPAGA
jgi:hypothetical protein